MVTEHGPLISLSKGEPSVGELSRSLRSHRLVLEEAVPHEVQKASDPLRASRGVQVDADDAARAVLQSPERLGKGENLHSGTKVSP